MSHCISVVNQLTAITVGKITDAQAALIGACFQAAAAYQVGLIQAVVTGFAGCGAAILGSWAVMRAAKLGFLGVTETIKKSHENALAQDFSRKQHDIKTARNSLQLEIREINKWAKVWILKIREHSIEHPVLTPAMMETTLYERNSQYLRLLSYDEIEKVFRLYSFIAHMPYELVAAVYRNEGTRMHWVSSIERDYFQLDHPAGAALLLGFYEKIRDSSEDALEVISRISKLPRDDEIENPKQNSTGF